MHASAGCLSTGLWSAAQKNRNRLCLAAAVGQSVIAWCHAITRRGTIACAYGAVPDSC